MSIDFSIQQQQGRTAVSPGTGAAAAATGSLFGNAAPIVESPMSLLADAAEELTL